MGLYYLCSENKGADHLRGYPALVTRTCKSGCSYDAAHLPKDDQVITVKLIITAYFSLYYIKLKTIFILLNCLKNK